MEDGGILTAPRESCAHTIQKPRKPAPGRLAGFRRLSPLFSSRSSFFSYSFPHCSTFILKPSDPSSKSLLTPSFSQSVPSTAVDHPVSYFGSGERERERERRRRRRRERGGGGLFKYIFSFLNSFANQKYLLLNDIPLIILKQQVFGKEVF